MKNFLVNKFYHLLTFALRTAEDAIIKVSCITAEIVKPLQFKF